MRHGRWRTETCKNMNVKDSVDKKLDLTKARHIHILVYKTALSFASYKVRQNALFCRIYSLISIE